MTFSGREKQYGKLADGTKISGGVQVNAFSGKECSLLECLIECLLDKDCGASNYKEDSDCQCEKVSVDIMAGSYATESSPGWCSYQ